mgnify:CR=1 FL=1
MMLVQVLLEGAFWQGLLEDDSGFVCKQIKYTLEGMIDSS